MIHAFCFGPGLVVNGVLKAFWGRARPSQILEFGGAAQFTPPVQIADQCARNCSFVSGEASGVTMLAIAIGVFREEGADAALLIALAYIVQVQAAAWYVRWTDRFFGAAPAPAGRAS